MFLFRHTFILERKSSNLDVLILSVFESHTFKQCDSKDGVLLCFSMQALPYTIQVWLLHEECPKQAYTLTLSYTIVS